MSHKTNNICKNQFFDRFAARLTLWLFVRVVQHQISSVVHSCGQMLHWTLAKLVDAEDKVVVVGHTIYEILKDVDAERVV